MEDRAKPSHNGKPHLFQFERTPLEADKLFPLPGNQNEPQTVFLSPYYSEGYRFPYNPDTLVSGNNYRIYDEMRDDDQVKIVLAFKKDMVINSGWKIICDNDEIREEVECNLKEGLEQPFEDVLRDILTSYEYGFSVSEPVYRLEGSRYYWQSIKTRPPHTFLFDIDQYGQILAIVQMTQGGEVRHKPEMLLHHVYNTSFCNPYGKSDLKAAHEPWKAKKFVKRFMNIYLEKFASPLVVGKYKSTLSQDQAARLNEMLQTIQTSTTLSVPEDVIIEIVQTGRDSTDSYTKAINLYNMMIARAALVPDLMGIGGSETAGGSYSLGQTQFRIFLSTIQKDRKALERLITMRLIKPMVHANWGEEECRFEFNEFSSDDEIEFSKLWVQAVTGKIFQPNEDEVNHLRSQLRFPQGDVVIPEPQQPQGPFGREFANPRTFQRRAKRNLTIYERNKQMDVDSIADVLERSESLALPRFRAAAKRIYSDMIERIRDSNMISAFKPEKLNDIEPHFLKDMNRVVRDHFVELFRDTVDQARKEVMPLQAKKMSVDDPFFPDEFEEFLKAETFKITGDYATNLTKRMKNTVSRGIRDGLVPSEVLKLLRADAQDMTDSWLTTIIRTETTSVYNQGRKAYWESDPIASQIVTAWQFSAILDERTTEVCEYLDGKIFEEGEFADRIVPPLHFNCRSLLVPITRFEDYRTDKKFISPGSEPSLESLKKKGGGLLLASEEE